MTPRLVLLAIAAALALPHHAVADDPQAPAGGFRAYIDPATGADAPAPPPGDAPARTLAAPTPAAGDPVAVPNPLPGGGGMIDVRGRLQTDLTATLGPDGEVSIGCH